MRKEDRKPYPEKAKAKIRTTKLLKRLQAHAMGEIDMKTSEIRAAEVCLRKTLPDLKAVENTGELSITQSVINAQPEQSIEEWVSQHSTLSGNPSQDRKPH